MVEKNGYAGCTKACKWIVPERTKKMRATPSPYDCGGNPTKDYPGE